MGLHETSDSVSSKADVGVVVIGRNEGERLKRCLRSLVNDCRLMVYVDSGSTDGSGDFARSLGVDVVDLDLSLPFTMARGRNAGFQRLCERNSDIQFVQFVDGDCEIVPGWLSAGVSSMAQNSDVVAVCGRLREKFPEATRFNQLCDLEWEQPEGFSRSCGGIAMYRMKPFRDCRGFDESLIAGEEGELCFRLRSKGWKILRLASEMGIHDAAITTWTQWFKRVVRGGHAYAEGAFLHGNSPERYNRRQTRSALFWGLVVPCLSLLIGLLGLLVKPALLALLFLPVAGSLIVLGRIYCSYRRRGRSPRLSMMGACFCLLAKFPEAIGVLKFRLNQLTGKRSRLIEYKVVQN